MSHSTSPVLPWARITLLGLDIDGTLTDGLLFWGGPEVGWTQRYAVRDGEAIVRLARPNLHVVPISRNKTLCAKARMQGLGLPCDWVGVDDKVTALAQVCERYAVSPEAVCYVGDGREDAALMARVGVGCCVADGHPACREAAAYVTQAPGGRGAVEEVIEHMAVANGWPG
jgi:3-deoxy-D-manno-octulosonate 8-phosphate phosphatase (KDO 8-P phosphatase)